MRSLIILSTLVLLVSGGDPCWDAYAECEWDFLGTAPGLKRFLLKYPDIAFTPQIVAKDPNITIGVVNMNGAVPEFILRSGRARMITNFGYPRFTPTHFKPYELLRVMGCGVGLQTPQGNQLKVLRRRCVRVRFTHYQKFLGGYPPDVANLVAPPDNKKCVVFITMTPH